MDMIRKIALTASAMLFVLAQVFSFYVIITSWQGKIDLMKEKENKIFEGAVSDFNRKLSNIGFREDSDGYLFEAVEASVRHRLEEVGMALLRGI